MSIPVKYDEEYYRANGQLGDRPALGLYVRLVGRYGSGQGPRLDFGCGTGHLVKRLAAIGPAAGFEISEYSAQRARETAPGSTIYTGLDQIPNGSFGDLTAIHVLEHLPEDAAAAALASWRRVLRPGGRVLAVMPDPAGRGCELAGAAWNGFKDPTHINLKSHHEWARFLTEHGFRVLREGSDGLWDVPYRNLPKLVDAALHAGPSLAQFLSGRLFLKPGKGESAIFVCERA
ncbi:MAG TPA: class I SAM-dependent methyltransferase [Pseudonocardiaceae bacterium]|jgi:SAM-dependent methyltransferase|nr:class I SAM-dependent methyltransferase [Pseudonocardiaceae bacterium]